ncbi:unnamed protein product [Leuciscus chuanchicus]
MDWDNGHIIRSEPNKYRRWIKEAIEIRKRAKDTINRDEGAYILSQTWNTILQRPASDGGAGRGRPGGTVRYRTTKSATESQRFTIRQMPIEFHRINANLRIQFYKELDRHMPKHITLFRDKATKTGKIAEEPSS